MLPICLRCSCYLQSAILVVLNRFHLTHRNVAQCLTAHVSSRKQPTRGGSPAWDVEAATIK
jgi:hypothetical protein